MRTLNGIPVTSLAVGPPPKPESSEETIESLIDQINAVSQRQRSRREWCYGDGRRFSQREEDAEKNRLQTVKEELEKRLRKLRGGEREKTQRARQSLIRACGLLKGRVPESEIQGLLREAGLD